jgi:hypothetical protein
MVFSPAWSCLTGALGGHVARCENENFAYAQIAYNSCRNPALPKCQGTAAREWLAKREAELLPIPYFHVVFLPPAHIADIARTSQRSERAQFGHGRTLPARSWNGPLRRFYNDRAQVPKIASVAEFLSTPPCSGGPDFLHQRRIFGRIIE